MEEDFAKSCQPNSSQFDENKVDFTLVNGDDSD